MYQNIDGLVDGAFGDNVLDPGLVHIHGPTVLENSSCCVKVLGTVHLVGPIKKEVARLVGHRCKKKGKQKTFMRHKLDREEQSQKRQSPALTGI